MAPHVARHGVGAGVLTGPEMHPPFFFRDEKECAVHGVRKNLSSAPYVAQYGDVFAVCTVVIGRMYRAARDWRVLIVSSTNRATKTSYRHQLLAAAHWDANDLTASP